MHIRKRILAIGIVVLFVYISLLYFLRSIYVFPILMYHGIDKNPHNSKIIVTPEDFKAQMDYLKKHQFRVISLNDLVELLKADKKPPLKTVVITFDDGYDNNYKYAYPALKENDFPATIFVVAGLVDKDGYLTTGELREMSQNRIDIGSHSFSHRWLPKVDKEEDLIKEIIDSKDKLKDILNKDINLFCYPAGGFDNRVKALVKSSGYLGACTTSPGRNFPDHDIFALKRVRISGGKNNLLVFRIKISGYHTWIKEHRDDD
ncbi:MAG: polysaccharide deacetylase family protein [Candidatus Omnitrophica bacterium]|nr:polysaccharide deacetylase family protein [Candidatus Omnitrophota bacterium]